jgi:integrase
MPKRRNQENRGLPARWRLVHGAYYYQVPVAARTLWDGKYMYRLGKTLSESYRVWAERIGAFENVKTIGELLDRYAVDVVPEKAPVTQKQNSRIIKQLRSVFGSVALIHLKPKHIYQYVDKRSAKIAAHREIQVLKHAFTKAVEWGYLDRHPFKGEVRLAGEKPRTRYIEDWEVVECLSLPAMRKRGSVQAIQAYIRIKLLTGLRRGDLLRLQITQITDDGITIATHKTSKPIIYDWTPELRQAVKDAKAARPVDISPWLFCNKRGQGYVKEATGQAYGWDSMWQRYMTRILKETKVTERFTEHDLRAKCASDAQTLDHARALLAHADSRLTQRVYRRRPERVKPLR